MATEVVMPQMGESIAEGTITKWLVQPGDKVERDQPLFEISTDKVDAEIPSPVAGVLKEIKAEEGQTVPVNEVVALVDEGGEAAPKKEKEEAAEAKEEKKEEAPKEKEEKEEPEAKEEKKEEKKEEAPKKEEAKEAKEAKAAEPEEAEEEPKEAKAEEEPAAKAEEPAREKDERAAEEREKAEAEDRESTGERTEKARGEEPAEREEEPAEAESAEERLRRFSSPLVRKIAQEEGVDLAEVEGTGVHGRVTKQDILGYLEKREEKPAAKAPEAPKAAPAAPAAAAPAGREAGEFQVPAYVEGEDVDVEPMSRIRQITAAHMRYSKATSAHVTTVFHVDFSRVARARARAKNRFAEANDTKLTYMPFIFKAIATALKKHRKLNAAIDGTNVVYKNRINVGMAVDVEGRGLMVPVIRDADELSLTGLAKEANDLAERARSKKLGPDELKGGTFTVTNPGVFGSLFGTPIINQPQVAILGVGAIEKRPVVVTDRDGNDAIVIKTMCYLSITYDHRLVDGADADRFMIDVKKVLEEDSWSELDSYSK